MIINYKDGSTLHCTVISLDGKSLIADEMYIVDIKDVADITDDEEEE